MTGPLNYTTKIEARRTVQECLSILVDAGADSVAAQYRDKQPIGLSFQLETPHGLRTFALPVNIDGVHKLLQDSDLGSRNTTAFKSREQAARVGWRVVRDWLVAQLAIIDAQMVTLDEVMLPYLQVEPGVSLYEAFVERNQLALTAGGES